MTAFSTVLKIALRDLLNSRGFVLLFLFNLFLGISGFVVLHTLRDNVNNMLAERARGLLGADLSLSGRRALLQEEFEGALSFLGDKVENSSKAVGVYSMAKAVGKDARSRLVQLKAVEGTYPYYGSIELREQKDFSLAMEGLQEAPEVWVDPALLVQMNIEPGDKVKLGDLEATVSDVIESDSSVSWSGVGLAPKVYISLKSLARTQLISFGSVATYTSLIQLQEPWRGKERLEQLRQGLEQEIKDPGIRIRAPESASEQVGRTLNYLSDYLGLVGLVALFLSGIGAGYLFQNYLFEKLEDVAILKSVGMSLSSIFSIYLLQLSALSLGAVLLANLAAWLALPSIGAYLYQWINIEGQLGLTAETFGISFLVSLGTSVLICAPVLVKMVGRRVKSLFEGGQFFRWDFQARDLLMYLPLLAFMWALAIVQARSFAIGSVFTLALLAVTLVVSLIFPRLFSLLDEKVLRKTSLRFPWSLNGGLAARYFARDRLSSTLSISAITVGVMLLSLIGQLETSIKGELLDNADGKPSLFLFDIQEEQKEKLERLAEENNLPLGDLSAMVSSRVLKVNGEEFKRVDREEGFSTQEEESSRRMRNRSVNLSYALKPSPAETIVAGKPFPGVYKEGEGIAQLSLEKRYAQRMGIELGDRVTFEILGVEVEGEVANLRQVRWTSFLPNFFIVFQPGVIEDAPKTFLGSMGVMSFEETLRAQELVVEAFPNISIVNVTQVIEQMITVFNAMAMALAVMAALSMLVGFFVLFAIIQNQLKKKTFEVAIQKVFGVESGALLRTLLKEYFALAAISCFLGIGFSLGMGIIVSELFFDGVWTLDWAFMGRIAAGVFFVTAVLALGAGKTFYSLKVKSLLR